MRGVNTSAVQWVFNCKGSKDYALVGGMMKILRALEVKGKLCFHARHVASVNNSLTNLITLCEPSVINAELKRRRLNVNWRG